MEIFELKKYNYQNLKTQWMSPIAEQRGQSKESENLTIGK